MAPEVEIQQTTAGPQERSLGELFSDLARETSTLIREEVALAKAEISKKVSQVGKDMAMMAAGGAIAYGGFLALIAALIIGMAELGVPGWLSALIVGLVVAGVGGYLVQKGMTALKREDLAPRETIETLKEDARWIKEQTRSRTPTG